MLKENRKKDLITFSNSLNLEIKNLLLLNQALTHGSFLKEKSVNIAEDNERLEFFGDAVLKLYVSEFLMERYRNYSEGELSKLRAYVVSEKILAKIANKLNFKKYLLLGRNEKKSIPISILADSLEAVLAVVYYECGSSQARKFILSHWLEYIESADKDEDKDNFKASLQEYSQARKTGLPAYKTISEIGPDHNKEFEVAVFLSNNELARGYGKTKKEASQAAAKKALIILERNKNAYHAK